MRENTRAVLQGGHVVTVIQKTTDSKEAVRRKWRLRDAVRIPARDQHGPLGMGRSTALHPQGKLTGVQRMTGLCIKKVWETLG